MIPTPDPSLSGLYRSCVRAGRDLAVEALTLWHAGTDPLTPGWARTVIMGALAYLVFPADAIPDIIPFAGYSDDAAALAAAIALTKLHVTDEHLRASRALVRQWFGAA